MIKISSEQLELPEFRRAVATGDWATALHAVVQDTGASQTEIAIAVGVSQPHISRLMNGRSREPGVRTVRAICNGLGIPLSLAGLLDDAQGGDTNRRQFISGAAGVAGLAMIGTVDGEVPVDSADDERLLAIPSSTYRRLEQRMPSRQLLPPVTSHLALIRYFATKDGHDGAHRRRLFSLLSETAGLAAWLYMDVDDRAAARRHYQLAVRAAERSGHPLLRPTCKRAWASSRQHVGTQSTGCGSLRPPGSACRGQPHPSLGYGSIALRPSRWPKPATDKH